MKDTKNFPSIGSTIKMLLTLVVILAGLLYLSTPGVHRDVNRSEMNTSIHQMKQLQTALDLFASDWDGQYPNAATGKALGGSGAPSDAAAAFTQLIASRTLDPSDEALFYVPKLKKTVKDLTHVRGNDDGVIHADENAYSYVPDLTHKSEAGTPIITSKLASVGVGTGTFYTKLWDHKAAIVRVNGSVRAERLAGSPGTDGVIQEMIHEVEGQDIFSWAPETTPLR